MQSGAEGQTGKGCPEQHNERQASVSREKEQKDRLLQTINRVTVEKKIHQNKAQAISNLEIDVRHSCQPAFSLLRVNLSVSSPHNTRLVQHTGRSVVAAKAAVLGSASVAGSSGATLTDQPRRLCLTGGCKTQLGRSGRAFISTAGTGGSTHGVVGRRGAGAGA